MKPKTQCQNLNPNLNQKSRYDLEERTVVYSEKIINLIKCIPKNEINRSLLDQLLRSATSVGANYMEGDGAQTKKDLRYKFCLCRKEAKESKYWLRLIKSSNPAFGPMCKQLIQAHELALIFSAILNKV